MTIRQLRTLIAVADHKTFSAAAEVVHVTHAAVSQQMQALEADMGVALFNRKTRTPELTPLAHQIVAKARDLVADYDNLVPSVLGDGGLSGVLTMGVMRTTLTGLTPQAVTTLRGKFPDLGLHIRPGLTSALVRDIERNQLDTAVISKPHVLPAGVVFRPLTTEALHLVTAPQDQESDPQVLLRNRPFIRFDRAAVVGALIDNWLQGQGIKVRETMELDSLEAITSMVAANLGVSILPDMAVKPQSSAPLRTIALGPDAPKRILGLVHLDEHPKRRALDEVFAAFASVIEGQGA